MNRAEFRWLPLISTVILAAGLWFMTFFLTWGNFWFKISLSAATLAALALWLQPLPRTQWSFDGRALVFGCLSAIALYGIFWAGKVIAIQLLPFADHQIGMIYGKGENTSMWLIAVLLLFVTGPSEEIYWRGYLQRQLMERWGSWRGGALATALYAGVHLWSGNFMLVGAAAVAGIFWGGMYGYLGRLSPVIISHSLWSAVVFTVLPLS